MTKRDATEVLQAAGELPGTPPPSPDSIDCPLCGKEVKQVASATLSLALWQHTNWACEVVKAHSLKTPPPDGAAPLRALVEQMRQEARSIYGATQRASQRADMLLTWADRWEAALAALPPPRVPSHLQDEDEPCSMCGSRIAVCECPATPVSPPPMEHVWCGLCGSIQPLVRAYMPADERNDHAATDLLCATCRLVIATLHHLPSPPQEKP